METAGFNSTKCTKTNTHLVTVPLHGQRKLRKKQKVLLHLKTKKVNTSGLTAQKLSSSIELDMACFIFSSHHTCIN